MLLTFRGVKPQEQGGQMKSEQGGQTLRNIHPANNTHAAINILESCSPFVVGGDANNGRDLGVAVMRPSTGRNRAHCCRCWRPRQQHSHAAIYRFANNTHAAIYRLESCTLFVVGEDAKNGNELSKNSDKIPVPTLTALIGR